MAHAASPSRRQQHCEVLPGGLVVARRGSSRDVRPAIVVEVRGDEARRGDAHPRLVLEREGQSCVGSSLERPFAGAREQRNAGRDDHRHVSDAVVVEVGAEHDRRGGAGGRPGAVLRDGEVAVAAALQDLDAARLTAGDPRDGQIEVAISVEVARRDGAHGGRGAARRVHRGRSDGELERAVALAEQHVEVVVRHRSHDQVEVAVAVEVAGQEDGGVLHHLVGHGGFEGAARVTELDVDRRQIAECDRLVVDAVLVEVGDDGDAGTARIDRGGGQSDRERRWSQRR